MNNNNNTISGHTSTPPTGGQGGCLFDVYPLFNINIVTGKGCQVWADHGHACIDLSC